MIRGDTRGYEVIRGDTRGYEAIRGDTRGYEGIRGHNAQSFSVFRVSNEDITIV